MGNILSAETQSLFLATTSRQAKYKRAVKEKEYVPRVIFL
jgi:hypothetical protein